MLRRPIRQTHKSGAYIKAVVEDVTLGYATVRLANNGARLTRLPILGGAVSVGENVIVDYSAGIPPLVRPITTPWVDELELETGGHGEALNEIQSDVSFKVYGTSTQLVGKSYSEVEWSTAEWQTESFFSSGNPTKIVLPYDGFYFIYANIAVQGFADHRDLLPDAWEGVWWIQMQTFKRTVGPQVVIGEMLSSDQGAFGFNHAGSMDLDPSKPTTMDLGGMVSGTAGDEISLVLKHSDPDRDNIDLVIDTANHAYPKIWGFRMTRGGFTDDSAYAYGSTPSTGDPDDPTSGGGGTQDDDSDIEIRTNMGYLHVSDDSSSTYARGIALVGDYASLELTLDYRFEDTDNGAVLRLQLRATRDWYDWETPTRCYEMNLSNTGGFGLHRVENGTRTFIGGVNKGPTVLDHKLRFYANGTSIKAKTWLASESEPGTWDIEVTDTGGFTDLGGLQLGFFNQSGDHKVYIDNLDLHVP